jgi:hypothetical protein
MVAQAFVKQIKNDGRVSFGNSCVVSGARRVTLTIFVLFFLGVTHQIEFLKNKI